MGKDETVSSYAGIFDIGECLSHFEVWIFCKLKYFYSEEEVKEMIIFCFILGKKKK